MSNGKKTLFAVWCHRFSCTSFLCVFCVLRMLNKTSSHLLRYRKQQVYICLLSFIILPVSRSCHSVLQAYKLCQLIGRINEKKEGKVRNKIFIHAMYLFCVHCSQTVHFWCWIWNNSDGCSIVVRNPWQKYIYSVYIFCKHLAIMNKLYTNCVQNWMLQQFFDGNICCTLCTLLFSNVLE